MTQERCAVVQNIMTTESEERATDPATRQAADVRPRVCLTRRRPAVLRHGEPLTFGMPLPRGRIRSTSQLSIRNGAGAPLPIQVSAIDRWSDGSIRWALLDTVASSDDTTLDVEFGEESVATRTDSGSAARLEIRGEDVAIKAAPLSLLIKSGALLRWPIECDGESAVDADRSVLLLTSADASGAVTGQHGVMVDRIEPICDGPLRVSVRVYGHTALLDDEGCVAASPDRPLGDVMVRIDAFAGLPVLRVDVSLTNPRPAVHEGGFWRLGDAGSIFLREMSLTMALPRSNGDLVARLSPELDSPLESSRDGVEIYQDSSGGENWDSTNHLNRRGAVPHAFRGYRMTSADGVRTGLRATPIVGAQRGEHAAWVAMPQFWENFPKAAEIDDAGVKLSLFPRQSTDVHELQGGERRTHTFYLAFGPQDGVTEEPLAWVRDRTCAKFQPQWYAHAQAMPHLIPATDDPHEKYKNLVQNVVEGDDSYFAKRERIDQYGWRHFGDVWGDHEAVRKTEGAPLASQYNNQYDQVRGFLFNYMRSGDERWVGLADDLASHVADVDIYHTDEDRVQYNHGLFWHTWHYYDQSLSTHRTHPAEAGSDGAGGGPSGGHLYTFGLLIHYFMTGDLLSRDAVAELGQYVIDADDGSKTKWALIDGHPTGHVSESAPDYHGPGRATGNAINTLLDAHRLTGEARFLQKAEELLKRAVHPDTDLAVWKLDEPEIRWFYLLFMQSLGKYLDYKAELDQLGTMYAYGRAVLLKIARWMAEHEYVYLSRPDKVTYPTETWAAQEMRKVEVFCFAARHATGSEREVFLRKAEMFFDEGLTQLGEFPTRTLCRPTALLMCYGASMGYMDKHADATAAEPSVVVTDFGPIPTFTPQKAAVLTKLKMIAALGALTVAGVLTLSLWAWLS